MLHDKLFKRFFYSIIQKGIERLCIVILLFKSLSWCFSRSPEQIREKKKTFFKSINFECQAKSFFLLFNKLERNTIKKSLNLDFSLRLCSFCERGHLVCSRKDFWGVSSSLDFGYCFFMENILGRRRDWKWFMG